MSESQQPVVAEFSDPQYDLQTSHQKSTSCLLPCLVLAGLFLFVLVGGGFAIYQLLTPDIEVLSAEESQQRLEQKYDSIKTAFNGDEIQKAADAEELKKIQQLFRQVAAIADFSVKPQLKQIIDYKRYAQVMRTDPNLGTYGYFGDTFVTALLDQQIIGPLPFSEIQIYRIEELARNERLVYAQVTGEYGDDIPFRFWLNKTYAGWKLFDWEHIRYGLRDTEEIAALTGDNNPRTSSDYATYLDLYDEYTVATEGARDSKKIRSILRQSEALSFHPRLHGPYTYDIAHRHWFNNDEELAEDLLNKIKDSENVPGKMYLLGLIYHSQGKYQEALDAFDSYHGQVGYDTETLQSVAGCYQELGRTTEELETRWRIIRDRINSDYDSLSRIVAVEGVDALKKIFADPVLKDSCSEQLAELAEDLHGQAFFEDELKVIVKHFADQDAGSKNYHQAAGALDIMLGDFDTGIQHLITATGKEDRYQLLSTVSEFGGLQTVLEGSDDLLADFKNVTYMYEQDGVLNDRALRQLTDFVTPKTPESAFATYWAGRMAFYEQEFDDAAEKLKTALEWPNAAGRLEDYEVETAESLLVNALFKSGNTSQALEFATDKQPLIEDLTYLAFNADSDHELLPKLQESLAGSATEKNLAAKRKFAAGEFSDAATLFADELKELVTDENDYWQGQNSFEKLMDACEANGSMLEAFDLFNSPRTFELLSARLVDDQDWEQKAELIAKAETMLKDNPNQWNVKQRSELAAKISFSKLELNWHREDYENVLVEGRNYLRSVERAELWTNQEAVLRFVRAAVRLNKGDQIDDFLAHRDGASWQPAKAMSALFRKDFAAYRQLNQELYGNFKDLHLHATEIKLTDEELRQVSEDTPTLRSRPAYRFQFAGAGLAAKPDDSVLKEWAQDNEFELIELQTDDDSQNSWLLRKKGIVVAVMLNEETVAVEKIPKDLRDAAGKQRYMFEARAMGQSENDARRIARQLVKAVAVEPVLLRLRDKMEMWESCAEDFDKLLSGEIYTRHLLSKMKLVYEKAKPKTSDPQDDSTSNDETEYYTEAAAKQRATSSLKFARLAKPFVTSYLDSETAQPNSADGPDGNKILLTCELYLGGVTESLVVELTAVRRNSSYFVDHVGVLQSDSKLSPMFKKGDRVVVQSYMIQSWQQLDADGNVIATGTTN